MAEPDLWIMLPTFTYMEVQERANEQTYSHIFLMNNDGLIQRKIWDAKRVRAEQQQ